MKHRYGYLVLAILVLLAGILWYSFSRKSVALPPVAQLSPSGVATTTPENTGVNIMTLQPPSGWRVLKQSATSVIFTDLPANAIIYDNLGNADRASVVDNDTLGYSEMYIEKLTESDEPAWMWKAQLAAVTDPNPKLGQTVKSIDNKVVESEGTGRPGYAIGTASLIYANTSTIYGFSLLPYDPTSLNHGVSLSSSTIQIYQTFIADFVGQLP